jgi:hypothetical protein
MYHADDRSGDPEEGDETHARWTMASAAHVGGATTRKSDQDMGGMIPRATIATREARRLGRAVAHRAALAER